jgi:hypothetical protein
MGLFIAATTYNGAISLAITADPVLVPDAEFLAECLRASLDELRKSTKAVKNASAVKKKTRRRAGRAP